MTAELLGQERRVTVMEKICEDVLGRLRLSSSAMDAYFQVTIPRPLSRPLSSPYLAAI